MSANKNALEVLMDRSKSAGGGGRKRKRMGRESTPSSCDPSSFFPCPAGCGVRVTERSVNGHLDRCLRLRDPSVPPGDSDGIGAMDSAPKVAKSKQNMPQHQFAIPDAPSTAEGVVTKRRDGEESKDDAFSRMMKSSATAFRKSNKSGHGEGVDAIRQRFHLHDVEGRVSWICEDESIFDGDAQIDRDAKGDEGGGSNGRCMTSPDETIWSATITMKKVKSVALRTTKLQNECSPEGPVELDTTTNNRDDRALELTLSSSLPLPRVGVDAKGRLVRIHSRLSVGQLKSCLQKSIRRRAPLPAVRVAMELVDRSWGDLIRRLPIIVLEDSTLHPDFGLLVWLMVAESKGYFPCLSLLKRVLQIVFEVASCPQQDALESDSEVVSSDYLPRAISLKTSSDLFQHPCNNACEVLVRSMLLRAQYGGMKCDVQMLHSYSILWLKRFQSGAVPTSIFSAFKSKSQPQWPDFPRFLHANAHEKSGELITSNLVCSGGLAKLNATDVCSAGIDFHCSNVVDHLLSQRDLYASFCEHCSREQLRRTGISEDKEAGREWMSGVLKGLIWKYSSGINHRRLVGGSNKKENEEDSALWNEVVKIRFDDYTKQFVKDRLGW